MRSHKYTENRLYDIDDEERDIYDDEYSRLVDESSELKKRKKQKTTLLDRLHQYEH